jgi:hypothetical protein
VLFARETGIGLFFSEFVSAGNPPAPPHAITCKQMPSHMVSEISYSPSLEVTFEFILRDSAISNPRDTPSYRFITAARFLKNNAPHLFQIREMGAKSENRMDRWLWDLLTQPGISTQETFTRVVCP